MRPLEKPVYFDSNGRDYFAGVDETNEGYIWRRDGKAVPVRYMHKTFADYFNVLAAAGFQTLPKIIELKETEEHLGSGPCFFRRCRGLSTAGTVSHRCAVSVCSQPPPVSRFRTGVWRTRRTASALNARDLRSFGCLVGTAQAVADHCRSRPG
jgi:hypothetical protein